MLANQQIESSMAQYAALLRPTALDTFGLVRTGSWKNAESADRYNHTIASPRRGGQI